MNIIVVESPAKATTIEKYLGKDYKVLATFGHVRDLLAKDGAVDPEENFSMKWQVDSRGDQRIKEVAKALSSADRLLLATDPDREGEAISWHLVEELASRKKIKEKTAVERISFNAITKQAVTEALEHPRQINQELVDAYLARRALDHLVGFNLSPVLWRTLPGARSAGRVQSVAVRLLHERECEIEAFKPREYWSVVAILRAAGGEEFAARLTALGGDKIGKFDLPDEASARRAEATLRACDSFRVAAVESKPVKQKPPAPFITSTLQQDASRKLGYSASQTMSLAQRLYEDAWITYMRTDGVDMAPEAVAATRQLVQKEYGADFLPDKARVYKSKVKNAQEAHECIRPTEVSRIPAAAAQLPNDQRRLYQLIWERTVASQMADAVLERTTADIAALQSEEPQAELRASGQVVKFEGFRRLYREGRDRPEETASGQDAGGKAAGGDRQESSGAADAERDEASGELPALAAGDRPDCRSVTASQHFTKPPARYSEASLVQKLEELGIGRPSTYASILSTILSRNYVEKSGRQLAPTFLGRMTTAFLTRNFERYVANDFTANLEERLDDISGGRATSSSVLKEFWTGFAEALKGVDSVTRMDAMAAVEETLEALLYPPRSDGVDPHVCPACQEGRLSLRWAKTGMFLGCGRYPDCRFRRPLDQADEPDWLGDRALGQNEDGEAVSVRRGPYGFYLQLDTAEVLSGEKPGKPKRVSLPDEESPYEIDLEQAKRYLSLPRMIGEHPDDGKHVRAGIGRFGPYVQHDRLYASIPKGESVFDVNMNRAVDLLADKAQKRSGSASVLKELGEHPDGGPVQVLDGRYGPYVKWAKVNATIKDGIDPAEVTMEQALGLIADRLRAKGKKTSSASSGGRKAVTKKRPSAKSKSAKPAKR